MDARVGWPKGYRGIIKRDPRLPVRREAEHRENSEHRRTRPTFKEGRLRRVKLRESLFQ